MSFRAIKATCVCGRRYIAPQQHHKMTFCTCGKTGVDFETYHIRWSGITLGDTEFFEPPWFDDEDEYHSALLSWLNDSDEEYTLRKTKKNLWVVQQ